MGETLLGSFYYVACADCGKTGCVVVKHCGKLVPDEKTAYFCLECFKARDEFFKIHGKPKPLVKETKRV